MLADTPNIDGFPRADLLGFDIPYASRVENLLDQLRARYRAWFAAMDLAGVERRTPIDRRPESEHKEDLS